MGLGTISSVVARPEAAGLDWAQVETLPEAELESRLYGRPDVAGQRQRPQPDGAWIHAERAKPGVTLELLHLEYLERHPDGYRYTRFCDLYRRWLTRLGLNMRQVHRAGDKLFVDYAGQKPAVIDPGTGRCAPSSCSWPSWAPRTTPTPKPRSPQQVPDWLASHQRAFSLLGGVTAAVVPDQLKSGVVVACRTSLLQRTHEEFAQHYAP